MLLKQSGSRPGGGIAYTLFRFSLPLVFSGILQQLYSWADAFIVGNVVGELALSAVGATGTVTNFYMMVITGFTLGLAILFAQKFGADKAEEIPQILLTFSILLGAVFVLAAGVGIWLTGSVLRMLHTTQDTVLLAEQYLKIVLLGTPFLAVYNTYSAALRGVGDSRAPFFAVLVSSAVNVGLDILFVAGLGWGVAGAAAATVASQAAMTVFLVVYAGKKHAILRLPLRKWRPGWSELAQGFRLGVPPMIQSSISACGSLLLQNFMNGFGTQTVTAVTTAYRVDTVILLPIINLGSGISTITAQHHGAGEEEQAGRVLKVGTVMMTVVSLLLMALVIPTGGHLIAMFGAGEEAVAIGENFFRRIACFYVVYGCATAVRGYLEGLGDVFYSSAVGIVSLIFRIILSYAAAGLAGNMIIAYAEGISWGVLLVLYLVRLVWKWRTARPGS